MTTTPVFDLRPVDATRDADVLHRFVTKERASFWGMTERTRDEVAEIYGWIQEQPHLEAYLVHVDDRPVGILQTYDPFVDEIGDFYERREGDLGLHFLLDDDPRRAGLTAELAAYVVRSLLGRPGVRRLVVEPDARNEKSVARAESMGFVRGPRVHLTTSVFDKPAQFMFLTAEQAGL